MYGLLYIKGVHGSRRVVFVESATRTKPMLSKIGGGRRAGAKMPRHWSRSWNC